MCYNILHAVRNRGEIEMSKYMINEIVCPNCGNKQSATVWESVNVSLNPECKDQILNDQFFQFKCEKCNKDMQLAYNCLYNDISKREMIWLIPELTDEIKKEINQAYTIQVDGRDFGKMYLDRIVDTPNGLKEKIIIFDEGYDDRIIEIIKIIYMSQLGQITGNDELMNEGITEMLFDNYEGSHSFVIFFEKINPISIPMDENLYIKIYQDFIEFVEEKTKAGYLTIDYDWAKDILKKKNN